ncbi:MAG: molybdopterin converting factor subunit 1 [bacterium]|nr:molybdopterin converting factor subunit 1 [bacterium]
MKVKVLFFASCRDVVGMRESEIELAEGATVVDLMDGIAAEHVRFKKMEASLMVSVNQEYVDRDAPLKEGDEVAFIPPVSGG